MAQSGVLNIIHEIHGKDETKHFLEKLGFVVGGNVTVITEIGGNMIVNVKDARIAISKGMASKIMVA
jgi:Fe2+ transport system protein A